MGSKLQLTIPKMNDDERVRPIAIRNKNLKTFQKKYFFKKNKNLKKVQE